MFSLTQRRKYLDPFRFPLEGQSAENESEFPLLRFTFKINLLHADFKINFKVDVRSKMMFLNISDNMI